MVRNKGLEVYDCTNLTDWTSLDGFNGTIGHLILNNIPKTQRMDWLDGAEINSNIEIFGFDSLVALPRITLTEGQSGNVYVVFGDFPALLSCDGLDLNNNNVDQLIMHNIPNVVDFHIYNFKYNVPSYRYVYILSLLNVGDVVIHGRIVTPPMFFNVINTGIRHFDYLSYNASDAYVGGFVVRNNSQLTSLAGLKGIGANPTADDQFYISTSTLYYPYSGYYELEFEQLFGIAITNNDALESLDGLEELDNVVGPFIVCGNDALTTAYLPAFETATQQPNDWSSNPFFSSIYPLEWQGDIVFCNNTNLVDIVADNLNYVYGSVTVSGNTALQNIEFAALTAGNTIDGDLTVTDNGNCTDCDDVSELYNILVSGSVTIDPCVPHDVCSVSNPCLHGGVCTDTAPCDDTSYVCNCTGTGWPLGAHCNTTVCGDGIAAGNETCDDGNSDAGDGCENDCTATVYTSTSSTTSTSASSSTSVGSSSSTTTSTSATETETATATSSSASASASASASETTTASTATSESATGSDTTTDTTSSTPTTDTTDSATATSSTTTTTTTPTTEDTTTSDSGDNNNNDAGDAGKLEAERKRRNTIIAASVGGSVGGLLVCGVVGAFLSGMCGAAAVRDSKKGADVEVGNNNESSSSSSSSSMRGASDGNQNEFELPTLSEQQSSDAGNAVDESESESESESDSGESGGESGGESASGSGSASGSHHGYTNSTTE